MVWISHIKHVLCLSIIIISRRRLGSQDSGWKSYHNFDRPKRVEDLATHPKLHHLQSHFDPFGCLSPIIDLLPLFKSEDDEFVVTSSFARHIIAGEEYNRGQQFKHMMDGISAVLKDFAMGGGHSKGRGGGEDLLQVMTTTILYKQEESLMMVYSRNALVTSLLRLSFVCALSLLPLC